MLPIACEHDGVALQGEAAVPEGEGPFPTVLVMHSAYGLGDHVRQSATRLAALGYAAIATDMYGAAFDHGNPEATGLAFAALHETPDRLRARTVTWFDAAAALPFVDSSRIAAIGYCFGGLCVLELARSGADVKAVVSYHGILTTHRAAAPGTIKGEVVAYCGARDPYAPLADIDALRAELIAAGAHYQITIFGDAAHSFTDPVAAATARLPGIEYNEIADLMSWASTIALLQAVLRG